MFQTAPTETDPHREKRPHSIAVIPLTVPTQGEDVRFLADGVTEDLILELGRFRRLFVSSRTASAVLQNGNRDPVAVGDALGVRYVLSGNLRRMGARVRINLSLAETSEGRIVWSDRIERPFETLLDTLDEIVAHVAATVIGRLEEADIAAARRQRPESMSAYECHLRGLEFHRLGGVTNENLLEAVKWFDRAIEADPNFGRPYAMKVCAVAGLPNFDIYEGERVTHRALQLDRMIRKRIESWARFKWPKGRSTPPGAIIKRRWSSVRTTPTSKGVPPLSTPSSACRNARSSCWISGSVGPVSACLVCRGAGRCVLRATTLSRRGRALVRVALSDPALAALSDRVANGLGENGRGREACSRGSDVAAGPDGGIRARAGMVSRSRGPESLDEAHRRGRNTRAAVTIRRRSLGRSRRPILHARLGPDSTELPSARERGTRAVRPDRALQRSRRAGADCAVRFHRVAR